MGLPKIVKTIDEGDTSKLMYGHKVIILHQLLAVHCNLSKSVYGLVFFCCFQGMLQGANAIQLNLEQHHVLQKVFQDYPVWLCHLHHHISSIR